MVMESADFELQSLEKFKNLSSNPANHGQLLADKKAILFAATLTDRQDLRVVELCLDILENFLANRQAHGALIGTFGVYEALDALMLRMRNLNPALAKRAANITETLRNEAPPALSTRSRTKMLKKHTVHLLHIPMLSSANREMFEKSLVRISGVISLLVDGQAKRCTLRLCPKASIVEVVEKIWIKCGLKCLVVRKNAAGGGAESFYDVLMNGANKSSLEYPEEDFLQKSGALATLQAENVPKSGLLHSMKQFWTESFYW